MGGGVLSTLRKIRTGRWGGEGRGWGGEGRGWGDGEERGGGGVEGK